jgi:hypothetical protein
VTKLLQNIRRQILPWAVSAAALIYVFGFQIDWHAIPDASADANMPLFILITVLDKLAFFLVWGLFQAAVVRRFIRKVPVREVLEIKAGSELVRSVNNSLSDATFLLGVSRLLPGVRLTRVVAIASIPFFVHIIVLLIQISLAFPFLKGGLAANADVVVGLGVAWIVVLICYLGVRMGYLRRLLDRLGVGAWIDRVPLRALLPYFAWFALFAVFDVWIQGMAARSFGLDISWIALMARIPILYFALTIPSLGNFGTREIAFATLYSDFGEPDQLYAFALWTNTIFLIMHVIIGSLFISRAMTLLREVRSAREEGKEVPTQILHDAIDP